MEGSDGCTGDVHAHRRGTGDAGALGPAAQSSQALAYVRNGITNLYTALNMASGQVIADATSRHRAEEFPPIPEPHRPLRARPLDVHVVLDNSSTH